MFDIESVWMMGNGIDGGCMRQVVRKLDAAFQSQKSVLGITPGVLCPEYT